MGVAAQSTKTRWISFLLLFVILPRCQGQSVQRGEMEDILKIVSADVQKNFYDPQMKGLDWPALTEETRQRIDRSNNMGQMILAVCSLLAKLDDSHTYFIPPLLTQQAYFGFSARAYGEDVLVYEVEKKGPAAKAGLAIGDKLSSLNGVAVNRQNIRQVMRLLETVVPTPELEAVVVSPEGAKRTLHLKAKMIVMQEHQYIENVWRVADRRRAIDTHVAFLHKDYDGGVSYVAIPSFKDTQELTYAAIKRAEHSRVVVLDFRGNTGGWEETLLAFLGFFSEEPRILGRRISSSKSEDIPVKPHYSGFKGAIVVLVDSSTGSAAELAARYLQLQYNAQIVGDQTSGMVNEGRIVPGKIGAKFLMPFATVVTEAKIVMPDGEELERRGITPDSVCIPRSEDLRLERDPCLDQALALARKLTAKQQVN